MTGMSEIVLLPAQVQGDGSAGMIAAQIKAGQDPAPRGARKPELRALYFADPGWPGCLTSGSAVLQRYRLLRSRLFMVEPFYVRTTGRNSAGFYR